MSNKKYTKVGRVLIKRTIPEIEFVKPVQLEQIESERNLRTAAHERTILDQKQREEQIIFDYKNIEKANGNALDLLNNKLNKTDEVIKEKTKQREEEILKAAKKAAEADLMISNSQEELFLSSLDDEKRFRRVPAKDEEKIEFFKKELKNADYYFEFFKEKFYKMIDDKKFIDSDSISNCSLFDYLRSTFYYFEQRNRYIEKIKNINPKALSEEESRYKHIDYKLLVNNLINFNNQQNTTAKEKIVADEILGPLEIVEDKKSQFQNVQELTDIDFKTLAEKLESIAEKKENTKMTQQTEFINESNLEFTDISSEQYRIYEFNNGKTIMIVEPLKLNVSKNGGHKVYDNSGMSHYIPQGWCHISWKAKPGKPNFVK